MHTDTVNCLEVTPTSCPHSAQIADQTSSVQSSQDVDKTLLTLVPPLLVVILGAAHTDTTFVPRAGRRRGPVENGCHGDGAQLYPFALGETVSRPPPAGPHHADEGEHLCPRQLGVPAGNPEP